MGYYSIIFFLVCLVPRLPCTLTPGNIKSSTDQRDQPDDEKINIVEIRSDGVKFSWDKTGGWIDETKFDISVKPSTGNSSTPWPQECSDSLDCFDDQCSWDTVRFGTEPGCAEPVTGCSAGKLTVTLPGGDKPESIDIVTGPSSGKTVNGAPTPDYTPIVTLDTDESNGAITVTWEGPAADSPDSKCAKKALIQTWIEGQYHSDHDVVHDVVFGGTNRRVIQPDIGRAYNQKDVEIKVIYQVEVNKDYRNTEVFGSSSTKLEGGGGAMGVSPQNLLISSGIAMILVILKFNW